MRAPALPAPRPAALAVPRGCAIEHRPDLVRRIVLAGGQPKLRRQQVRRIEARVHALERHQRAREQTGRREQGDRQRQLNDDERIARRHVGQCRAPARVRSMSVRSVRDAFHAGGRPKRMPVLTEIVSAKASTGQSSRMSPESTGSCGPISGDEPLRHDDRQRQPQRAAEER